MNIRHNGRAAIAFGLSALAVYLVMVLGTLEHLSDLAGAPPFDLRPAGYSQTDAADLLHALGDPGRRYYLTRQVPLDTLYPGLLALTLISTFRWRAAWFGPTAMTRLGGPVAILAAGFDYVENIGVALMLLGGPASDPSLIQATSTASILKSILTSAAMFGVIATLAPLLFRHVARRRFLPFPRDRAVRTGPASSLTLAPKTTRMAENEGALS